MLDQWKARKEASDFAGARKIARKALRALSGLPRADKRQDVADARWDFGHAANEVGDFRAARAAWSKVLTYRRRALPSDHYDLQETRVQLAIALKELGRTEAALELEEKVFKVWSRLPNDHRDLLDIRTNLAITKKRLGRIKEALPLEEEVLRVLSRKLPDDDLDLQKARGNLARTKRLLGDLDGALALERKVYEVFSRKLPDGHPWLQIARGNLAATMADRGDAKGALPLQQKVLEIRERTLPEGNPNLTVARESLAGSKLLLGDLEGARSLFVKVLDTRSRTLPERNLGLQRARMNLASVELRLGRVRSAHTLLEKADRTLSTLVSRDHLTLIGVRLNLAWAKKELGDIKTALELEQELLGVLLRTLPGAHPMLQKVRLNLASTKMEIGDWKGALVLEEKAHSIWSRALPADHVALQKARINLATTKRLLGDAKGALTVLQNARDVLVRTLPADHPDLQAVWFNVGNTRFALGDFAGAHAIFARVYETYSRTLPDDHLDLQGARMNLAGAKAVLGDLRGARALTEKAFEISSRGPSNDWPGLQSARVNLGLVLARLGDHGQATKLLTHALEVYARTHRPDHPEVQVVRLGLAYVKQDLGDPEGALALCQEVSAAMAPVYPARHLHRQEAATIFASACSALGRTAEARRSLLGAHEAAERRLRFVHLHVGFNALERASRHLEELTSLVLSHPQEPPTEASTARDLQAILRVRGLASRQGRIRGIVARASREDSELAESLQKVRLARHAFLAAFTSDDSQVRAELPALRSRLVAAEQASSRCAADLSEVAVLTSVPPASELAKHIPPNGLAVITQAYSKAIRAKKGKATRLDSERRVAAFVVDRSGRVERFELGSEDLLAKLGKSFRGSVSQLRGSSGEALRATATIQLAKALAPLFRRLAENTKTLYVVPDGALAAVPWEALPLDDKRLLCDRVDVVYLDHLDALRPRPRQGGKASLLAFGGIDYGGKPQAVGKKTIASDAWTVRGGGNWATLPESQREAEAVKELFEASHLNGVVDLLTGTKASRASFLNLVTGRRYIHLATHAFVAPKKDWLLGRALAREWLQLTRRKRAAALDRGLLAGIVFAGANLPVEGHRDAGVLTASELAGLDLSACELAVLSACDTNVGPRHFGEAVTGLNRALRLAGARNTITSLWKVPDRGAAAFFEAFYGTLWANRRTRTIPEALARARAELRRKGYGADVWAAFVLYAGSSH